VIETQRCRRYVRCSASSDVDAFARSGCRLARSPRYHYGVELGADCILSFGAPTYHSPNLGGAAIQRRLYETFLSNWELDLRAFLQSRSYTSHINLFFGERELRDRAHALYLDDLDGVTLHPVSQLNDHECLRWFALNRDLRTLLGEWLGV